MKYLTIAAVIALSAFMTAGAYAGDVAAGKEKSAGCVGCHGMNGRSNNPNNPSLAGQKKLYLIKAMKAYREGARKDTMMNMTFKAVSDADIENLAAFYSSIKR